MGEWNIIEVEKMTNEQYPLLKVECFFAKGALCTTIETGSIWNVMYTPLENLIDKTSQEVVNYLIKKWKGQVGFYA